MIDQETRAALIADGWSPPAVAIEDYEPWRTVVIAYWQEAGHTPAQLIAGDPLDASDKKIARKLAAFQRLMPPMPGAE